MTDELKKISQIITTTAKKAAQDTLCEPEIEKLLDYTHIPETQRLLMSFPLEDMNPMAALRFGVGLLRQKQTYRDRDKKYSNIPHAVASDDDSYAMKPLLETARTLEKEVALTLGKEKQLFPNVDFYAGIVYHALGISPEFFTPLFAVSRVAGWTSRILEYLKNNRIFRPRALYVGPFNKFVTKNS